MKNMVSDKGFGLLLAAALLCCVCASCAKPYIYDKDIALTCREIHLTQYEGETRILVYSNGKWDASMIKPVQWASLSVCDSDGIGDMLFTYGENQGIARKAGIAIAKDASKDTVVIIQKGMNTNPQFAFVDEILSAGAQAGEYKEALVSNVFASIDQIESSAIYYQYGEPGPKMPIGGSGWIKSCRFEPDAVWFDLEANQTGERRSADIILRLNNNYDVDFSITLRLRQNAN